MAKTFNLESCDEYDYPNLPSSVNDDYTAFEGMYVSFSPSTVKRYYVTKNHQALIPYNYNTFVNEVTELTVNSLKINGDEKLVAPNVFTWAYSNVITMGIIGGPVSTFNYPSNYFSNYHRGVARYTGTAYQVNFVDNMNTLLLSHSVEDIVFYRVDIDKLLSGIAIEKNTSTSFVIDYKVKKTNTLSGASSTTSYLITFGSSSISYKVNGIETNVAGSNSAQALLTDQKAIRVYDYNLGEITQQEDCLCEECSDCFMLKNCKTGELKLACSDLQNYVGRIIKIDSTENCWEVLEAPDKELVEVVSDYGKCKQCLPKCITNDCN